MRRLLLCLLPLVLLLSSCTTYDLMPTAAIKPKTRFADTKPQDFGRYYDPMQVSAHKDAVSLFQRYSKGGDSEKLKSWAVSTLPALQHHLEMAQALDK